MDKTRRLSLIFFIVTILFTIGTYDYYRGGVFSRYHSGPVSADVFHLSLHKGLLEADGKLSFDLNVDAGPSAVPTYIVRIELLGPKAQVMESWDAKALRALPQKALQNKYAYNKIAVGFYGLIAPESANAHIILPLEHAPNRARGPYVLQLYTVDGKRWDLNITFPLSS